MYFNSRNACPQEAPPNSSRDSAPVRTSFIHRPAFRPSRITHSRPRPRLSQQDSVYGLVHDGGDDVRLVVDVGRGAFGDPLSDGRRSGEVGEGLSSCERIDIAILDIKLSSRIAYARKRAAVRRRIVRRGHAAVEKSFLALVLRPSAGTRKLSGENASAHVGFRAGCLARTSTLRTSTSGVLRPPLILGYEGLGCLRSASQLETDGDVSDAPQRAVGKTVMESVDDPFAHEKTL